ncbi:MAG: L-seryl-tRNA(Sec) selenium transferase, partial [Pseudomonadota bacterium]
HPLLRAIRIDKLSLAALEATLRLYKAPNDPLASVPVLRMLAEPRDQIKARAGALLATLASIGVEGAQVVETVAYAGGGSLPEQDLQSFAVALDPGTSSANVVAARMRDGDTPVLGRISEGRILLDVRAVQDAEITASAETAASALRE